jgi:hypothetical protein
MGQHRRWRERRLCVLRALRKTADERFATTIGVRRAREPNSTELALMQARQQGNASCLLRLSAVPSPTPQAKPAPGALDAPFERELAALCERLHERLGP